MSEQTQQPESEEFDPVAESNVLINKWLGETYGLPITLQLTKLGFAVIEALEAAYKAGQASVNHSEQTK